jgi:hypothetical protein
MKSLPNGEGKIREGRSYGTLKVFAIADSADERAVPVVGRTFIKTGFRCLVPSPHRPKGRCH